MRVQDLKHPERFAGKLRELLALHNAALEGPLHGRALAFEPIFEAAMQAGEALRPMIGDVGLCAVQAACGRRQHPVRRRAGNAARHRSRHLSVRHVEQLRCRQRIGRVGRRAPDQLHYILGITKAYTTRVGGGPFPTELPIDAAGTVGHHLSSVGQERGTVTGRARRRGWLDAAALKRSIIINGVSGLCITKLDVLDGLEEIKVATGYELRGRRIDILPLDADDIAACVPIYQTLPGWTESTFGATQWNDLPAAGAPLSEAHRRLHRRADRHGLDRP